MRRALFGVIACALGACTGELTVPPEPRDEAGLLPRCGEIAQPLAVTPASADVAEGELLVLTGAGGTGRYRWRLGTDGSGGAVAPEAGIYVAGAPCEGEDACDVVVLEDEGCRGDASAAIRVHPRARVEPASLTVAPSDAIAFASRGGLGPFRFALATNGSGGVITEAGAYTAGATLGRDVVRLTDEGLGTTADAIVDVVADAALVITPTRWVVPVGTSVTLPVEGGSGDYEVSVSGDAIVHESGTTVRAVADGTADVTIRDPFTSREITLTVHGVGAHEASRRHPGDRSEVHVVGGAADLDGDGYLELVVGMPDSSATWFSSGRVLVYRGSAAGLDPTPAMELTGDSRDEEYGTAVALGDVDADGRVDLIVGARRADPIRRDVGAVYVHSGVEGGLVSGAPTRALYGANSFDLFGDAIALCDFNADGLLDIAVGAPFGQVADGASDQGVVHVFLARSGGRFLSSPDEQLLGADLGGVAVANMRLGDTIAAGDFDGDGACDVAAYGRGTSEAQLDTGIVLLYRGVAATFEDGPDGEPRLVARGGIDPTPSLAWGRADGMDDDGRFGQSLALGDVNGDGRADLLAGRTTFDGAAGSDTGGLYLLHGRALDGALALTDVGAADASFEGQAGDRVGHAAMLSDVDGDGRADVVSGDYRAEIPEAELDRPGLVRVFLGGDLAGGPDRVYEGPATNARFGVGAAAVGDLDGDGEGDVVAFAPYYDATDDVSDDRGALYWVSSTTGALRELTMELPASGQEVGRGLAWIDLDGDGLPELAVGAPQADDPIRGRNVGAVRIYAGTADGASAAPIQELTRFIGHTEGDEVGFAIAAAGDVDGDGNEDLAVLARSEDLPAVGLDATMYDAEAACAGRRDNPAAVLIFLGQGDGTLSPDPAFAFFGPEANARIEAIDGGVDVNADGLDDVIVGGREWDRGANNAGGVAVFFGRAPAADGRVLAVCTADVRVDGDAEGMRLGHSVAALGDVDGDGCGDFAAGAPEADPAGRRNAGEVRVYFGFSPTLGACADTALRTGRLVGGDQDAQAGIAIAGGVDVTGDARPDLVVGAPRFRDARGEVGRAVVVSGAYAAARVGGVGALVSPSLAIAFVDGTGPGERLGEALALVPHPSGGGLAVLGGPFGDSSGRVDTGGAVLFGVSASGFAAAPMMRVSGESAGESQLGASVAARTSMGRAYVAIGAPFSSAVGVDDGASYAFVAAP